MDGSTWIDDVDNAIDRQRCFGDVRGHHNLPSDLLSDTFWRLKSHHKDQYSQLKL